MSTITPLGHKDTLNMDNLPQGAVVCGISGLVFASNDDYLNHVSPVTGYTPKDPQHFGKRFVLQSEKALIRGSKNGKLNKKQQADIDGIKADIEANGVDQKLAEAKATAKRKEKRAGRR